MGDISSDDSVPPTRKGKKGQRDNQASSLVAEEAEIIVARPIKNTTGQQQLLNALSPDVSADVIDPAEDNASTTIASIDHQYSGSFCEEKRVQIGIFNKKINFLEEIGNDNGSVTAIGVEEGIYDGPSLLDGQDQSRDVLTAANLIRSD